MFLRFICNIFFTVLNCSDLPAFLFSSLLPRSSGRAFINDTAKSVMLENQVNGFLSYPYRDDTKIGEAPYNALL